MNRSIYIFLICISFFGCVHPEGKEYERNQGKRKESNSGSSNEAKINASLASVPDTTVYEGKNILEMEIENGIQYVWIEINGIKLRFIFDTGASNICISPAEATVLYRQGTLRKEDILDIEYFQDATGKISEGTKINLREIKIGNMVLNNVKATIIDNINAPLLLGQTALERFGSIEINNEQRMIIFQ